MGGVVALAAGALTAVVIAWQPWSRPSDRPGDAVSAGLPATPDYHALLVSPTNADDVYLGTHVGLFRSTDAGATWRKVALDGRDAMNLARSSATELWAAGHNVLMHSPDGGASWQDATPAGLPSLDVHGFAVDPARPSRLWAAIAGRGLYRSDDGGGRFTEASREVGGAVMALSVLPDGRLLAGDMQRGLLTSDDEGRSWQTGASTPVMGLAAKPGDPETVLATGPAILRSTNAGTDFSTVLETPSGSGPVAFAPSQPGRAYVV
ncbi:MAG: hypothetical protein QOE98_13, partial [Gaiellaceae bacterium]|nr:hypothetical protein [Gaiellaceae bacterium]